MTDTTPTTPLPETPPQPYSGGKSTTSAYETLRTIVLVLLAAFLIRSFVAQPFVVEGRSMEPTFHNADYLVVNKFEYRFGEPQRGDVIVFRAPEDPSQNYIKRVIALPGETVKLSNGSVSVNGQLITESYVAPPSSEDSDSLSFSLEQKLGAGEYFVLGDNRDHSSDSRRWGPLPKANIIGKVDIVVFPLADFGTIDLPTYPPITRE